MDVEISGLVGWLVASSAEEFLDAIDPRRSKFLRGVTRGPSDWIFRGHGDAEWSLLPSLLRDDTEFWTPGGAWGFINRGEPRSNRSQVWFEASGVRQFFELADRAGLPLPEDSQRLRRYLSRTAGAHATKSIAEIQEWPPDELLPVLALAQHHGLPTRLLDWTYSPFTAAYFAAQGAIERERGELCVWIIRAAPLRANTVLHDRDRASVVLVTAPTASNPNLRAQEGVFTLTRCHWDLDARVDRRPLTETPELIHPTVMEPLRAGSQRLGLGENVPLLLKVKLAASEAPQLLRQLALRGTSAAKLFPGYEGVVRAMKEEADWEHLNR